MLYINLQCHDTFYKIIIALTYTINFHHIQIQTNNLYRLSILVLLLTLSNLGTSFAAAYIAKDTTINDKEELVSSNTKKALSTQSTSTQYNVEALSLEEVSKIRRLCTTEDSKKDTGIDCETESGGSGYVINDTTNGYCGDIQKQCEGGNTVDIYRTFSNGERVTVNICGPSTTVLANNKKGRITFRAPGLTKINMQYRNYGCTFDGNDLTQQEGEVCDASSDCARKHKCYQQSEGDVRLCRDDCTKNFRGRDRRVCTESCGGNTCERINKSLVQAGATPEPSRSPSPPPTTARPITNKPSTSKPTSSHPTTVHPTTSKPTTAPPTRPPTGQPVTDAPTSAPSGQPSGQPSVSSAPSKSVQPSMSPSMSNAPSLDSSSQSPSSAPSYSPSDSPSQSPSFVPSLHPSNSPSNSPVLSCPPKYALTTSYQTGNEATCGGNNVQVTDPVVLICNSAQNTGSVWYYTGKKWKEIGECKDIGFVRFDTTQTADQLFP